MRQQRRGRNGRGTRAAALAAGLAAACAGATPTFAELPAFGMMTVARRQTATLHLVLTHTPDRDHPGCYVTASFVNARGEVLKDAAGAEYSERMVLRDNVAQALFLRAADVVPVGEPRTLIRAAVRETPDPGVASNCCALTLTTEIASAGGSVSHVGLPRSPNPPSPFCSVGASAVP